MRLDSNNCIVGCHNSESGEFIGYVYSVSKSSFIKKIFSSIFV
jgi:hypothetical protein